MKKLLLLLLLCVCPLFGQGNASGTAVVATAAQGGFWGPGVNQENVGGTAIVFSPTGTNNVLVFEFALVKTVTVRKVVLTVVTTSVASTANVGIYTRTGNLLIDSGTFDTASATTQSKTLGAPVTLPPGIYYFAQACTATTPTSQTSVTWNGSAATIANTNGVRQGLAANALAAGALPATLGTVTGFANRTPVAPLFEP